MVCILPDTDLAGVRKVGEAILEAIRAMVIPHAFSKATNIVTVSMGGISLIPEYGTTAKKLIEAADAMLYQSKEGGRDRLTS